MDERRYLPCHECGVAHYNGRSMIVEGRTRHWHAWSCHLIMLRKEGLIGRSAR